MIRGTPPLVLARVALLALAAAASGACGSEPTSESGPVATIALSAADVSVAAGAEQPVTAQVLDEGGRQLTRRAIVWTSRDNAIATVVASSVASAVVRGVAPGTTEISANVAGRFAVATVRVLPQPVATVVVQPVALDLRVGGSRALTARTLAASGTELPGRVVTFSSGDPSVATVSTAGIVTGVAPGSATITVASEGRTTLVAATVTPVPVASVAITPGTADVTLGATLALSAATLDSIGRPLAGRAVAWSTGDATVAAVSAAGVVTGVGVGSTRVTATSGGQSASIPVVVTARPVAAVSVSLTPATLAPGESAPLVVRLTDATGQTLAGRAIAYASDASGVATVSAAGVVTAVAPGQATISATSEGVRGTVVVRVVATPVATVDVTPPTATIGVGGSITLVATPRSGAGAALAGRVVTWTSGAPGVVSVAADGRVTAIGPGVAVVFAQSEGIVGRATVTVVLTAVGSVRITPNVSSVRVGAATDLAATPLDAAGNALPGRVVVWSSTDESIAVVSSTGRVVGRRPGLVGIIATSEGATGAAAVTVTP